MGSLNTNTRTIHAVIAALKTQSYVSSIDKIDLLVICKTELDTHDNMIVLGNEYFSFETTGKTCNIEPSSSGLGIDQNIPIVDAVLAYDCPSTYDTYISIIHNDLLIISMIHHIIPPFIMREGALVVNGIPKMH